MERGWMDETVEKLKAISAAALSASLSANATQNATQGQSILDPQAVGKALAELLKNDNTLSQSIAVRIANLSAKYPQRAY
jgi:Tfp pilus assembly PilM family ATPase